MGLESFGVGLKHVDAGDRCASRSCEAIDTQSYADCYLQAPVAQLDRASVYGTEGHRFESCRARTPLARVGLHGRWVSVNRRSRCDDDGMGETGSNRDDVAALGLRVRLAELTDELHTAIDAGLQVQSLHDIVGLWEANVGGLTFDDLVEEGSPTPCEDCGVDVGPNSDDGRPVERAWEWYMVRDPVWKPPWDRADQPDTCASHVWSGGSGGRYGPTTSRMSRPTCACRVWSRRG